MANVKIDLLTLDFPPIHGGISHYLYEIVQHMPPDFIRVVCVTPPDADLFDAQQKFEIVRLKIPTKWHLFTKQLKFFSPAFLLQLAKSNNSQYVLCGQAHYSLLLPAWFYSKLKRIPFGVFCYGLDLLYPQNYSYRTIFNYLLRQANVVFVDSSAAQNIAINLQVDPDKISLIYPTINPTSLANHVSAEAIRERHGLANKKCIVTVGRLIERKGHDIVIQSLPAILNEIPEAHYVIVGTGPYESQLKRLVMELGLENSVTFAGYVSQKELGGYFSMCDVFTMISREIVETGDIEGFGIVYLQASSFEKPIVAGNSGGVPDAVLHEQTGLLVNPTDPNEVSVAITHILQNPALAKYFGVTGKNRVQTQFRSEEATKKVLEVMGFIS